MADQFVPLPRRTYRYCNVCERKYNDYRSHVATTRHQNSLRKARIEPGILELVRSVQAGRDAQPHFLFLEPRASELFLSTDESSV